MRCRSQCLAVLNRLTAFSISSNRSFKRRCAALFVCGVAQVFCYVSAPKTARKKQAPCDNEDKPISEINRGQAHAVVC
jgi:hypothetical protein